MSEQPDRPRMFGAAPDGSDVMQLTIKGGPTTATLLTYGARLQDLRLSGVDHPLVLGAPRLDAYLGPMHYHGAIVGPVANRIAGARFGLGGRHHDLDANENGKTTLHGGRMGFAAQNWTLDRHTAHSATFALTHPDGRDGFPGNIAVQTTYRIDVDGALHIEITAHADRDVFFSPAFHGYWNLTGRPTIHDHTLWIKAGTYLPVDAHGIPTGAPVPVAGTGFDFTTPAAVTGRIDHNFCLDPTTLDAPVCTLTGGALRLDVLTNQPGLQVYDAGRNDTTPVVGLTGAPYGPVSGIALEPQFWPDTPNRPDYPSNLLAAGKTYRQVSIFRISPSG